MRRFLLLALACALLPEGGAAAADDPLNDAAVEHFERVIRPILANRCYECHDQESGPASANLRLDDPGGWLTGGDSGPAIDADHPGQSLLLRAVSYDDPDLQMPPRSKLPERELALLRAWVEAGAPAPKQEPSSTSSRAEFDLEARRAAHWAWRPVQRPALPEVQDAAWSRDNLDRFVLARLEAAGLAPADAADRGQWLRRVTYDLTGLPPTVEEVEEFLADDGDDDVVFERQVDRLLASSAFGEHWGQHWLDLMRFAETKGHEQDYPIPHAWRYRDYVIRAFNAGVPYDRFVTEHIAGDLLPEPRIDPQTRTNQSIQATAWWHLGEATHSPVDIRGEEAERIDNQIDVFGKALLGMTVACARCHDHKFDAISTADYYALCGFIQSSSYQEADVSDPEKREQVAAALTRLNREAGDRLFKLFADETRVRLQRVSPQADPQRCERLAKAVRGKTAPSEAIDPSTGLMVVDFATTGGSHDEWLTSGTAFGDRPVRVGEVIANRAGEGAPLRIADRAAATNQMVSPAATGLYRTRTFEVSGKTLWYRYRGKAKAFLEVDSHRTVAGPLHGVCRQELSSPDGWEWHAHDVSDYAGHRAHVDFTPTGDFELAVVAFSDKPPGAGGPPSAELFRLTSVTTTASQSEQAEHAVDAFTRAIDAVEQRRATPSDARLVNWLLTHDDVLPPLADAPAEQGPPEASFVAACRQYREQRQALEAQLPEPQFALALLDGSGEDEHVHLRGSHKRVAPEPTPRRFLTALGGGFSIEQGSGRLELARRVASPDNPLTSRVMVNRVWAHLMGRGIAPTVDNLGVLGQPPTHPELLDYLASEFVASGWDVKQLIRRVALSSTYRQSSRPDPSLDAAPLDATDPANDLLHATRVRRIPAESIRDALLAVSGELDPTPFGPSVPVQITDFMRHNRSPSGSGPLDGARRRSIYVEVRRNAFNHFLAAFDKPIPSTTIGMRHQSNSAAQPLMLLNDPLVHLLVGKWAEKLTASFDTDQAAIRHAYVAAFARPPTDEEQRQLQAFLDQHDAPRDAAWKDVCLALVNSKEFVFLQ